MFHLLFVPLTMVQSDAQWEATLYSSISHIEGFVVTYLEGCLGLQEAIKNNVGGKTFRYNTLAELEEVVKKLGGDRWKLAAVSIRSGSEVEGGYTLAWSWA